MAKSTDFFEEFDPHTQHKLLILEKYFESWGFKLGQRKGAGDKLLYVDACAGPGSDGAKVPGSPLIAARAAAVASDSVSRRRGIDFRIHIVAIEKKPSYFKRLRATLQSFGSTVRALPGTLADHQAQIDADYGDTPRLSFIDPFGIGALLAADVERAMVGPRSEVFVLFASQAALRHVGAVVAELSKAEKRLYARLERENARRASRPNTLFPELDAPADAAFDAKSKELAAQAALSRQKLLETQKDSIEKLDGAYGNRDWIKGLDGPAHAIHDRLIRVYQHRLISWGARYTLPIPILSKDGKYVYTLIHATKSRRGYAAMKEAVEYAMKHSDLPADAIAEMRDRMKSDHDAAVAAVLQRFAGRRIQWALDKTDPDADSVGAFLLEETETWPSEKAEVQKRLKRYRVPGLRKNFYEFPKVSSP